jgi:hypothetical protein
MSKTIANVLYTELRRGQTTAQVVVVPPTYNAATEENLGGYVLTRQVSSFHPRRSWKFYPTTAKTSLLLERDILSAVDESGKYVNEISAYFSGFASGGWLVYKKPIAVGMSVEDLKDIKSGATPSALHRRILRVRLAASYDESLFETD